MRGDVCYSHFLSPRLLEKITTCPFHNSHVSGSRHNDHRFSYSFQPLSFSLTVFFSSKSAKYRRGLNNGKCNIVMLMGNG